MYETVAKAQGVRAEQITGTCQNDILKEYTAQNEYIYPPAQAVKLVVDTMEYAATAMPRYNPVSVSGYHIRDAGSTAVQELAFTLAAGHCYVTGAVERGLSATLWRRGSRSSGISPTISSRRSASSARPGACGPA
jgi:methylmalonyl-CoA mutase N-terminal domain/subunit